MIQDQQVKKDTQVKRILIGIGVAIIACCICLSVTSILSPTPATPTPTLDLAATKAAADTLTQAAIPTATATLTPTPIILPTTDAYFIEMSVKFQAYNNAFRKFVDHQGLLQSDIGLMLDTNWRLKMGLYLAVLDEAAKDLESISNVPDLYAQFDQHIKTIASETHLMVSNYTNGLDTLNADRIDAAATNLQNITDTTILATIELDRIKSSR